MSRVPGVVLAPVAWLLLCLLTLAGPFSADAAGLTAAFAATFAAATAAVCALSRARTAPAVPPTRVRTALRERRLRTAFLPQRDPDAAGRRRPRAPGRPLPTAA